MTTGREASPASNPCGFAIDHVLLCEGDRIAILYIAEIGSKRIRAVEFPTFGRDGVIREGEAMHGLELESA